MKASIPLLAALVALTLSCGSDQRSAEAAPGIGLVPRAVREGPAVVFGTVVEASSGLPIRGAQVVGPDGSRTDTDAGGRFELRGMTPGTEGPLVATSDGLEGRVVLRPLAGGRLEVVVHLR